MLRTHFSMAATDVAVVTRLSDVKAGTWVYIASANFVTRNSWRFDAVSFCGDGSPDADGPARA